MNLEKAMKNSERNSGHTVQGHVDGTGTISGLVQEGASLRVTISTRSLSKDENVRKYMNSLIVPKGFICVDGASLTVCEVNKREEWFTLMMIPHTIKVLKKWNVGDSVNIELDCLAKYVSSLINRDDFEIRLARLELCLCVVAFVCVAALIRRY